MGGGGGGLKAENVGMDHAAGPCSNGDVYSRTQHGHGAGGEFLLLSK